MLETLNSVEYIIILYNTIIAILENIVKVTFIVIKKKKKLSGFLFFRRLNLF